MKRIKHRDLTHYFITDHQYLPRAYVASCERFFRELKNLKLARLTAANVQEARTRDQAPSAKLQAPSALK
jgi:hypothetical protein